MSKAQAAKAATAKAEVKPAKTKKLAPFTHIDRSNGQFLRESELNPDKPHIGPVSGQASVEKLTEGEFGEANQ